MKNEKGITLVSLVIYIIVMIVTIATMSIIIQKFYQNNESFEIDTNDILEFSKFNSYFLKEIKTNGNQLDSFENNNYILFSTGNSFSISNGNIYYNDKIICKNIESFEITVGNNGDGIDKTILNITITMENFSQSMRYKIEDIY